MGQINCTNWCEWKTLEASYLYTFHNPPQLACLTLCGSDLPVGEVQLPDSQCTTAQKKNNENKILYENSRSTWLIPGLQNVSSQHHSPPGRNKNIVIGVWVLHSEAVPGAVRWGWTPTDSLLGLNIPYYYTENTPKTADTINKKRICTIEGIYIYYWRKLYSITFSSLTAELDLQESTDDLWSVKLWYCAQNSVSIYIKMVLSSVLNFTRQNVVWLRKVNT